MMLDIVAKPCSVPIRALPDVSLQPGEADPVDRLDFIRIGGGFRLAPAEIEMGYLVFDHLIVEPRDIAGLEAEIQRDTQAGFFFQPAPRCFACGLSRAWMTAAAVGPLARGMILSGCALLDQAVAMAVENEDRERSVKQSLPMDIPFVAGLDRAVRFIDEDHLLVLVVHDEPFSSLWPGTNSLTHQCVNLNLLFDRPAARCTAGFQGHAIASAGGRLR